MSDASLELLKGTVDLLVLQALAWGPAHGYAVASAIRQRTDGVAVDRGARRPTPPAALLGHDQQGHAARREHDGPEPVAAQALAAGQRKPGDWTVKGPGGKWGIAQRSIHLGKIAVPNALLALLSSKFQENLRGNPTLAAEARRMSDVRRDLMDHAQREIAEDDFRGAVKAIRARKDRERNARLAERRAIAEAAAPTADAPTPAAVPPTQQR